MPRRVSILVVPVFLIFLGTFAVSYQPTRAQELTPQARAALQAQYDELLKEIAAQQEIIKQTQAQKNTLQGDVTALNAKIRAAQAQIDAKNIAIKTLSSQIAHKNVVITQLTSRIESGKESLAAILRQTQMLDDYSVVSVAIGAQNVSAFFRDLDAFTSLQTDLHSLFTDINHAKAQTETEKANLAVKQTQTLDAKYVVETQKQKIASNKTQKQQLLAITTNKEAEYQKVLADRQAKAAAIRAALFPLRDTGAINEGEAIQYALTASKKTGVRAALVLAVLSQESDLGRNVGNCYVTNLDTGDGVGKNTGTPFKGVMKAPRDTVPFKKITDALGKDWSTTPVSCPQTGGYGGAMGPTQFIPSTWMLYEGRIKSALGASATNPWNAEQAIMAAALYLSDAGAVSSSPTAERNAACKYFSGHSCPSSGWIATYGKQVMAKADGPDGFQQHIDFLANN